MKVLHINCNYIGTALHQTMVEHLDKLDVDSSIFVPVYDKNRAVIDVNDNVKVVECFNKWDRVLFQYKSHKILNAVQKAYDAKNFDLIHAYTLFTDGNVAHELYLKYGIPYVVAIRNTDVNAFFKYMIHLRSKGICIMKDASAIFFLSKTYKDQVFERYIPKKLHKTLETKCFIIPNGIDDFWHNNIYENRDISETVKRLANKKLRLIYAGGIDKNKNVGLTLMAIDILIRDGWEIEFTVVGKNKDDSEFNKILQKPYVKYYSPRPKEQLIDLYRNADIFVMPSHNETFGLVYAEAMSQGLPVIYTRGQGFDGQFMDGCIGFSILPNSPYDIVDKIENIAKNYNRMVLNTIKFVDKFKWNEIVRSYNIVYSDIFDRI